MRLNTFTITFLALAAFVASSTPALEAPASAPATAPLASKVAVITIHGDIDYGLFKSLERRVQAARDEGATALIFEMDTYGGGLDPGMEMADLINNLKTETEGRVKTIAYIDKKAISAGALISLACQEIVMRHGTTLGDCQAIMISPQTQVMEAAPEKIQSVVRALMRKYAQSNGYPQALCEKMVDQAMEVYQVKWPDGKVRYLTPQEVDELRPEEREGIEKKLVLGKDKLLTMSDTEAHDYGFSRASVDGLDGALALCGAPNATVARYDTNWSEELVRFLNSMAVSGILMVVGIMAIYMAFKTPGFGVWELAAIFCFATLFLSKHLVGLAGMTEVLIFVIGIGLIAIEVFVIPGVAVVGIAGIVCVLVSLVLASQRFGLPKTEVDVAILISNLFLVFGSLFIATLVFLSVVRFLPHAPFLHKLILGTSEQSGQGYVVGSALQRDLIGKAGVALSNLRPAGRAEIEGEPLDVVTDGEFIDPGSRIVVSEVRGNRIVVRKA